LTHEANMACNLHAEVLLLCVSSALQVLPNQFQKGMVGPCPDNAAICNTLSCNESCTVGGTCVKGRCFCNLQYTGPECAKKLTPSGNYTTYVPVADDGASAFGAYDSGYLMVRDGCRLGRRVRCNTVVWAWFSTDLRPA
jgi:hypothetical protein